MEVAKNKPFKTIRLGESPYIIGIGGKEASKDMKMIFIEKTTLKHLTTRIINDIENGKLIIDVHETDETKDKLSGEAYKPIIRINFDYKALERDKQKLTIEVNDLLKKIIVPVENSEIFKDKRIVPILPDNKILLDNTLGKDWTISDKKLTEIMHVIKEFSDLERLGYDRAFIQDNKKIIGTIFIKDGRWNYLNVMTLMKEFLLLFEPYITTEIISKEEFFSKIKTIQTETINVKSID